MRTYFHVLFLILILPFILGTRFDGVNQFLRVDPSLYRYPQHPSHRQQAVHSHPEDLSVDTPNAPEHTHKRSRRAINDDIVPANANILNTNVTIQENHNLAYIAWSGKSDSDTIVMLFRDSYITASSTSAVYVSHNYGETFDNLTGLFRYESSRNVRLDYFIDSPDDYRDYIFVSQEDKALFTSQDEAKTFHYHQLTFTPSDIITHPFQGNILVAYDQTDQQAYISLDFGETWKSFSSLYNGRGIGGVYWGAELGQNETIYVAVSNGDGQYYIYKTTLSLEQSTLFLSYLVFEFDIASDYMYAVKIKYDAPDSKLLLVSFDASSFQESEFSSAPAEGQARLLERSYYVADASEGQLVVAVNHQYNLTNLYISESRGVRFSLSLERVLYHDPNLTDISSAWVYRARHSKLLDFHKAAGLRGIYIATQLTLGPVGGRYLQTFISYDKGGEWIRLTPPDFDYDNHSISCDPPYCYLNLASEFSSIYRTYQTEPILSAASTPGLIMATGSAGRNLFVYGDLMVSNTAGATWLDALPGFTYYLFGDNGGFMLAAHKYYHGHINFIYYSLDEGVNWQKYNFSEQSLLIWGISTEPGEYTTVVSIYGSESYSRPIEWVIVKLDLKDILGPPCKESDYHIWSPSDDIPGRGCLLGSLVSYQRKLVTSHCYQGTDFNRTSSSHVCACTRIDYECEFGFALEESDESCMSTDGNAGYMVPSDCYPGSTYPRSKGYRRVAGDVCTPESAQFAPVDAPCPGGGTEFSVSVSGEGVRTDSIWYAVTTGQEVIITAHFPSDTLANQTNHTFLWRIGDTTTHTTTNMFSYKFTSPRSYIVDITVSTSLFTSSNSTRVSVMDSIADTAFPIESPSYAFLGQFTQFTISLPVNIERYGTLTFLWTIDSHPSTLSYSPSNSVVFSTDNTHFVCWSVYNAVSNRPHTCTPVQVYPSLNVTGLSVQYTGVHSIQLQWDPVRVQFKGYQVLYRTKDHGFLSAGLLLNYTSFFIVPSLSPSTEYTFAVRAYTDTQYGPLSDTIQANTSETPDSTPRNLRVTVTANSLFIQWDAPQGSGATNFELFVSNSTDLYVLKISSFSYTLATPNPGVLYTFQVAAGVDREKYGSLSRPASVLSGSKLTSQAPSQFTARPYNNSCLLLSWEPLLYPNFIPVNPNHYQVIYYMADTDPITKEIDGNAQSYMLCGLSKSLYSLKIRAASAPLDPGPFSPAITGQTVFSTPDAPHSVLITALSATALQVRWNPPNSGSAHFYYIVDVSHCSAPNLEACCSKQSSVMCCPAARVVSKVSVGMQEVQLTNLNGDYLYQLVIIATSSDGAYCTHSSAYRGKTKNGVPSPPSIISSGITGDIVEIVFFPPAHPNGEVLGYQVISYIGERPVLNSFHNQFPPIGHAEVRNLWPGFEYTFYARAKTSQGYGMTSTLPLNIVSPDLSDLIPVMFEATLDPLLTTQDLEELVMSIHDYLRSLGEVFSAVQISNNSIAFLFKPIARERRSDSNTVNSVASSLREFSYQGITVSNTRGVDVGTVSSAINPPTIPPIDIFIRSNSIPLIIAMLISMVFNVVLVILLFSTCYSLYRSNKIRKQRYAVLTHFNAEDEEITLDDPMIQAENLMISNPGTTSQDTQFLRHASDDHDDDELILDNTKDDTPLLS